MKTILLGDVFINNFESLKEVERIIKSLNDNGYMPILNLEGSAYQRERANKTAILPIKKEVLRRLGMAEVKYILVNNHVYDHGQKGYDSMLDILGEKALVSTKSEPIVTVNHNRIILVGDQWEQVRDPQKNFIPFRKNSTGHDEILGSTVVVHGGIEYRDNPTLYQRYVARNYIDRGALAVIFIHSHVSGVCEYWKGGVIHYGLGNFYFDEVLGLHGAQSSASGYVLEDKKPIVLNLKTLKMQKFCPLFDFAGYCDRGYKAIYKRKYKISSSLRPRQLYKSFLINNLIYTAWIIAYKLVGYFNFIGPIKLVISKILNRRR